MDREIIIGRSSDLDMVLVEDMVSRKHAKISTHGGQVIIQDLGSTNGTFVNGEKIKRVRLREGDRILIGTSIIKLVTTEAVSDSPSSDDMPAPPPQPLAPRRTMSARSMAGTIDEIPLPDLLQLLSTSKKSGVLEVQNEAGVGRIYLRNGQIYYATIDDSFDLSPRKSIYRMLTWETGTFELQPPDDKEFLDELNEPTEGLLMEAMRQLDEIRRIENELPDRNGALMLANPLVPALKELKPEELDLLQLVHNNGQVSSILDKSPTPDLETYEGLVRLLKAGFIESRTN
jgi:pSer/pThr/pTyr-binding forkhead associated (FHA) protein